MERADQPDPGHPAVPIPSDEPRYCGTAQVAYPKAPPHTRPGPNRVAAFGHHAITAAIDPTWKATDFTDAVLVLCAGGPEPGTALGRACTYLDRDDKPTITVPLHAASYPIRAFELRTGQLIGQTAIETRGHCPRYLFDPRDPMGDVPKHAMAWERAPDPRTTRAIIQNWILP